MEPRYLDINHFKINNLFNTKNMFNSKPSVAQSNSTIILKAGTGTINHYICRTSGMVG